MPLPIAREVHGRPALHGEMGNALRLFAIGDAAIPTNAIVVRNTERFIRDPDQFIEILLRRIGLDAHLIALDRSRV